MTPTLRGNTRYTRYNVDSQVLNPLHYPLQTRYAPVTLTLTRWKAFLFLLLEMPPVCAPDTVD